MLSNSSCILLILSINSTPDVASVLQKSLMWSSMLGFVAGTDSHSLLHMTVYISGLSTVKVRPLSGAVLVIAGLTWMWLGVVSPVNNCAVGRPMAEGFGFYSSEVKRQIVSSAQKPSGILFHSLTMENPIFSSPCTSNLFRTDTRAVTIILETDAAKILAYSNVSCVLYSFLILHKQMWFNLYATMIEDTLEHRHSLQKGLKGAYAFLVLCFIVLYVCFSSNFSITKIGGYLCKGFVCSPFWETEWDHRYSRSVLHSSGIQFLPQRWREELLYSTEVNNQSEKLPQVWQCSSIVSFFLSLFLFLFFLFFSTLKCRCLHMIMRALVMLACLFLLLSLQTKMKLS